MKVLISDKSSPACGEMLRNAGHEVDEKFGLDAAALRAIIGGYHGLIVRSATKVDAALISAAGQMKVIGRAGSGVDNIDVPAAKARKIVVMNTPGANSNAVAELVLAHMLALSRNYYLAVESLKQQRWDKSKFKGVELLGKTVALLGYGRVSRKVAEKCRALGMSVVCYDPKLRKEFTDASGLTVMADLERTLREADFVSVHLTKRADTLNFIAGAQFKMMKKGVFLVNCSRDGIVNQADLLSALESGIVAGAALDVYDHEPPEEFTLISHPRVVCTPHIGASTEEAQENVGIMIAEQFIEFFEGKPPRNVVD